MNVSTLILISLATSLVTSVASVYVIERYDIVSVDEAEVTVLVPDFRGADVDEARVNATSLGLSLVVSAKEAVKDAKAGAVVRQSVMPGQRVPAQQAVSVVVADAVPTVPSLVGSSVDEATRRAQGLGFTIQIAGSIADNQVPVGQVARQMPAADADYVKGGAVTLQLSSGPGELEVPKLVGVGYQKAKEQLEGMGLKVAVGWMSRGETPTYVVLSQQPAPGTLVEPGEKVALTVNR